MNAYELVKLFDQIHKSFETCCSPLTVCRDASKLEIRHQFKIGEHAPVELDVRPYADGADGWQISVSWKSYLKPDPEFSEMFAIRLLRAVDAAKEIRRVLAAVDPMKAELASENVEAMVCDVASTEIEPMIHARRWRDLSKLTERQMRDLENCLVEEFNFL